MRKGQSASDAELVERSLSGSEDAFRELVERYEGMVRGVIRRFGAEVRREEDDLAQNALFTAHQKLTQLRDVKRFDTWLWGITARICSKRVARTRSAPVSLEEVSEPTVQADGLSAAERHELRDRVAEAMLELPEHHQAVVVLRYLDGLTHAEIASTLELSQGQVRSFLYRATRRLRDRLRTIWNDLYPDDATPLLPGEVREILRHHEDSVMVISEDLKILAVNRPYSCVTGFEERDVVGRHCYEINHGASSPCDPSECPLRAIGESDREIHVRHTHRYKDGSWHETDTVAFPVDAPLRGGGRRRFFVELTTPVAVGPSA